MLPMIRPHPLQSSPEPGSLSHLGRSSILALLSKIARRTSSSQLDENTVVDRDVLHNPHSSRLRAHPPGTSLSLQNSSKPPQRPRGVGLTNNSLPVSPINNPQMSPLTERTLTLLQQSLSLTRLSLRRVERWRVIADLISLLPKPAIPQSRRMLPMMIRSLTGETTSFRQ